MATFTQPRIGSDPSALENTALQMAGDPRTSQMGMLALLGYGADRQQANTQNEGYGRAVLAMQQRAAQAEQAAKGADVTINALKAITDNPGHAAAVTSSPYLSSFLGGTDLSGSVATGERLVNSKVLGEAGRGVGSMGMAGVTLDPSYLSGIFGGNVTQGASPIERAAAIRAASGGGGDTVTVTEPTTSGGQVVVKSKDAGRATATAAGVPNTLARALGRGTASPAATDGTAGVTTRAANAQEAAILVSAPPQVQAAVRAAGNKVVVSGNKRGFLMEGNTVWPIP